MSLSLQARRHTPFEAFAAVQESSIATWDHSHSLRLILSQSLFQLPARCCDTRIDIFARCLFECVQPSHILQCPQPDELTSGKVPRGEYRPLHALF
jgi:hypothetical protein